MWFIGLLCENTCWLREAPSRGGPWLTGCRWALMLAWPQHTRYWQGWGWEAARPPVPRTCLCDQEAVPLGWDTRKGNKCRSLVSSKHWRRVLEPGDDSAVDALQTHCRLLGHTASLGCPQGG